MENRIRLLIGSIGALTVWLAPTFTTTGAEAEEREGCLQQAKKQIVITCTYYDQKSSGQVTVPAWNYDRELIKRQDLSEFEDGIAIDPYRDDTEQEPGPQPGLNET